jgi:hypothetical protein
MGPWASAMGGASDGEPAMSHGPCRATPACPWPSRWLLGITGVLSIVLGILLLASPAVGGLALLWTIGVYAIIYGVMCFAFGLRTLGLSRHHAHPSQPTPTAG